MLGRALAGAERPAPSAEPWRAALAKKLDGTLEETLSSVPCGEALQRISRAIGAPVLHPDGDPDEDPDGEGNVFDYEGGGETVRSLLERIASPHGRYSKLENSAVLLTGDPALETHLHPVADLLAIDPGHEDRLFNEIVDFVQNVDPESWDSCHWCTVSRLGDMLVVRQSPETQENIRVLLDQMKRALIRR